MSVMWLVVVVLLLLFSVGPDRWLTPEDEATAPPEFPND